MKPVFLDTSGWFAALSAKEARHAQSRAAYTSWIEGGRQLFTTNLVVAEMQILLSRYRGSVEGLRFIDSLYQDPSHHVVFVDRDLEHGAVERWLRRFNDTPLSLADAVSFEVMHEHGIREVLALDAHFALAGFVLVPS